MTAPILVIAIGNESRGDDAIAPLLLRRLAAEGCDEKIELLEDFQLQVEHAMDLAGRELVLFMDAGLDTPSPYAFFRARPNDEPPLFSHALAPEAVLATYAQIYRQAPPPAFVLCIRGEQFELGAALSPQAGRRMEAAAAFVQALLLDARASAWDDAMAESRNP